MTSHDPVLRASDADRDHVAAVLGEALATGRLTSVEHADRRGGEGSPVIRVVGRATFGKIIVSRESTDWNLPGTP
ncbi:DUF1707 domain-containing protein [Streptosporangium sp. NBC_01755]|uniref:DUF1707 SHOCT-like domain-containing protein n=1 Tax=unclassified Streptosporangium TaxID=2632669 RepID=UPI002DD9A7FA|nr:MULTISPECIES: DUF1707 domain-containing protein [unclassified Streptosporangium]WSA25748.1 DUF1707 domain-containing protein [Streptosporangium sp. NBC_01810]WSD02862.1 DUF1707 domain-containing protein [Streptosporangium sp. NBC_01755]